MFALSRRENDSLTGSHRQNRRCLFAAGQSLVLGNDRWQINKMQLCCGFLYCFCAGLCALSVSSLHLISSCFEPVSRGWFFIVSTIFLNYTFCFNRWDVSWWSYWKTQSTLQTASASRWVITVRYCYYWAWSVLTCSWKQQPHKFCDTAINYLRHLNFSFSVNTALNPEETESALEATSYFTEDVTTEGNATLAAFTSHFRQELQHKSMCYEWWFFARHGLMVAACWDCQCVWVHCICCMMGKKFGT